MELKIALIFIVVIIEAIICTIFESKDGFTLKGTKYLAVGQAGGIIVGFIVYTLIS